MLSECRPVAGFVQRPAGAVVEGWAHGVAQLVADDVFIIQVLALRIR